MNQNKKPIRKVIRSPAWRLQNLRAKKDPHAEAKKQKVVTPEYMFLEAPRTKEFITGSEAAKEAVRRSNVDISIAYPITPQSETMQLIGVLYGEGYVKEYYRGEEEYGVMSAIAGGISSRSAMFHCNGWSRHSARN